MSSFIFSKNVHKNRQVTRQAVWDTYGTPVVFSCYNTHHDWGQRPGARCKQSVELYFLFRTGWSLLFKTPQLVLHLHLHIGDGKTQLSSEFVNRKKAQILHLSLISLCFLCTWVIKCTLMFSFRIPQFYDTTYCNFHFLAVLENFCRIPLGKCTFFNAVESSHTAAVF